MNQLEEMIKEKYDYVDIDASLPACRLYSRLGYQTVDHGIWECKNGVIQVYEIMKKQLINEPFKLVLYIFLFYYGRWGKSRCNTSC